MLGPALTHLLHLLDQRKDALTEFEAALYGELLLALQGSPPAKGDTLEILGARRLSADVGAFKTKVDLAGGGWTGGGTMQTGCTRGDCPNKRAR